MKLRNGKTFKDDEAEDDYDWGYGINPETGGCDCLDCRRIAGCVMHDTPELAERREKAKKKALAEVLYEAEVYALEKAGGDLPEGVQFLDFYLLHYRVYYSRTFDNRYREILDKISRIHLNRLMRKKPEDRGFICELCMSKVW